MRFGAEVLDLNGLYAKNQVFLWSWDGLLTIGELVREGV